MSLPHNRMSLTRFGNPLLQSLVDRSSHVATVSLIGIIHFHTSKLSLRTILIITLCAPFTHTCSGRLDKLLYVPLPSPDDRHSILRALSAKVKLGPDVDLGVIARDPHANGFSGADCAALLREAGLAVLRDGVLSRTSGQKQNSSTRDSKDDGGKSEGGDESSLCITAHHFQYAFEHVLPSVSKKDQARYDRLRDRMARARTRGGAGPSKSQGGGDASDVESSIPPPPSEGGARE